MEVVVTAKLYNAPEGDIFRRLVLQADERVDSQGLSLLCMRAMTEIGGAFAGGLNLSRQVQFEPAEGQEGRRDAQTGRITVRRPSAGTIEIDPVTLGEVALEMLNVPRAPDPSAAPEAQPVTPGERAYATVMALARAVGATVGQFPDRVEVEYQGERTCQRF